MVLLRVMFILRLVFPFIITHHQFWVYVCGVRDWLNCFVFFLKCDYASLFLSCLLASLFLLVSLVTNNHFCCVIIRSQQQKVITNSSGLWVSDVSVYQNHQTDVFLCSACRVLEWVLLAWNWSPNISNSFVDATAASDGVGTQSEKQWVWGELDAWWERELCEM